ncbi:MAG: ATP-binding cassette domain-containing protein, partial [Thermomicrobiales bacterium]
MSASAPASSQTSTTLEDAPTLIEVQGLQRYYPIRKGITDFAFGKAEYVKAVDDISFTIKRGEILALVGESGSGKSTTGRLLVRLDTPTGGHIRFDGTDVAYLKGAALKAFRRRAQIIFQNPFEAFDPRQTIGEALDQALRIHNLGTASERERKIITALENASLAPAREFMARYPHELSGGQSQRIATVRAMLLEPDFLVADEPVSMLDVSVRADILNQLLDLRDRFGMAILFITHDL